ncbi:MAG: response regulator [Chloroflexota bacterium]
MNPKQPILLVENDLIDIMTVKRALRDLDIQNPLHVAKNGEEGLEKLASFEKDLPAFILLDLNMPRMDGFEFLSIIKKDERLKMLPVIVLTTSNQYDDRLRSFEQSVAGYMVKPVDYKQFVDVIQTIHLYWTMSELP